MPRVASRSRARVPARRTSWGRVAAYSAGLAGLGATAFYGVKRSRDRRRQRAAGRWEKVVVDIRTKYPGLGDTSYGGRQKYGPALATLKNRGKVPVPQFKNLYIMKTRAGPLYSSSRRGDYRRRKDMILYEGYGGSSKNRRVNSQAYTDMREGGILEP